MGKLRFITAGESHGPALTAILEGLPAGLKIEEVVINRELARRQQGYGRGDRMKIETDRVQVQSGIRFGETLGSPITLQVVNRDWENWTERMSQFGEPAGAKVTAARPGHADLSGILKYDRSDVRDILERASARETTMRVAAGAVARQFLSACGVEIRSCVTRIAGIDADPACRDEAVRAKSELNCYDAIAEAKMKARIDAAKAKGDTLGGVFEIRVTGLPVGLGSHIQWDRRLDARLAMAMMSIQAIKGVEIGAGFQYGALPGSEAHDEVHIDAAGHIYRKTNRAGGLEGGMTNGEELVVRAVKKPIPTLMNPLASIDIETKQEVRAAKERSDVTAVAAASVVGEAMVAIVLAEALVEKFDSDNMTDLLHDIKAYQERIQ